MPVARLHDERLKDERWAMARLHASLLPRSSRSAPATVGVSGHPMQHPETSGRAGSVPPAFAPFELIRSVAKVLRYTKFHLQKLEWDDPALRLVPQCETALYCSRTSAA